MTRAPFPDLLRERFGSNSMREVAGVELVARQEGMRVGDHPVAAAVFALQNGWDASRIVSARCAAAG